MSKEMNLEEEKRKNPLPKIDFSKIVILKGLDGIQRFYSLLDNPPIHSVVCEIHPDMASVIYNKYHMTNNRSVNSNNKNKISKSLRQDEFQLTGDTIKFGSDEKLIDGQHRITACISSKKPILTHVVFNVNPIFYAVLDEGKGRTIADTLKAFGVKSCTSVAGALLLIYNYNNNGRKPNGWKNLDYLEFYKTLDGELLHSGMAESQRFAKFLKIGATFYLALHYLAIKEGISSGSFNNFINAWLYEPQIGRNEVFRFYKKRWLTWKNIEDVAIPRATHFAIIIKTLKMWLNWKEGDIYKFEDMDYKAKEGYPKLKEEQNEA